MSIEQSYVSQCGQDKFLDEYVLGGLERGFFVDIGAHDGKTFSNTYYFETIRKWSGLCVEPNPDVFPLLKLNRQCQCLNCGVGISNGKKQFRKIRGYAEMLSGFIENYHPRHVQRIKRELDSFGGSEEIIYVDTININNLLSDIGIREIHILSIDIEGGELEIIKNLDFDKVFLHCLCIENNYYGKLLRSYLLRKGFIKISHVGDEIYCNFRSRYFFRSLLLRGFRKIIDFAHL